MVGVEFSQLLETPEDPPPGIGDRFVKVFIAGAKGFLGRRLIRQLRERGHTVTGLARNARNEETIRSLGGEPRAGDLFEANSLAWAAAATAIPVSARPAPKDWEMNNRIRVDGTRALTDARHVLARCSSYKASPHRVHPIAPSQLASALGDFMTLPDTPVVPHGFFVAHFLTVSSTWSAANV
jgi:NAD-dependent epimerase/dehydratase family protein